MLMTKEDVIDGLGLGELPEGTVRTWLHTVITPDGMRTSDALLTVEDGKISGGIVDRSSGEGLLTLGFEATPFDGTSYDVISSDGALVDDQEVLQQFSIAVALMKEEEAHHA